MSNHSIHTHRFQFVRRLWKPAAVTGAGGTAIALWFDEFMMFGQEILVLVLLSIMAGLVYLLDIFMFKDHLPKREDITNSNDKGAKNN
jgi:hypothetical protein